MRRGYFDDVLDWLGKLLGSSEDVSGALEGVSADAVLLKVLRRKGGGWWVYD